MNKEEFNIKIDESGQKVLNANELIAYINNVNEFDDKEWLVSTYQGLRINHDLLNTKPIIEAAKKKLVEMNLPLDEKGNFNVTDLDILDYENNQVEDEPVESFELPSMKEDSQIKEVDEPSIAESLPESFDEVREINENYENLYNGLMNLGEIKSEDLTKAFGCIKHMINILPEVGRNSNEYMILKSFYNIYSEKYENNPEKLNGFIKEAIDRFRAIDKEFETQNTRKLPVSHGVANIVVLLEISLLGFLVVMLLN